MDSILRIKRYLFGKKIGRVNKPYKSLMFVLLFGSLVMGCGLSSNGVMLLRKMNRFNYKKYLIVTLLLLLCGCEFENNYNNPIRKNIDPSALVSALKKDSLFYSFKGYGVRPRDERSGTYLVSREKEKHIYHWVKYNPIKTKFMTYYNFYFNDDSVKIYLTESDSIEILNKAHELIGVLKKCELRWAGWEFGRFDCSFNDSTRMTYVEDKSELDSNFYRFHKNLNWIDSNFVTY
jgi:hypothetical protein